MKKIGCFVFPGFLFFTIVFSLTGCSGQQVSETDMTLSEIAAEIQKSQQELPELSQVTSKDDNFMTWLSDYYLLQEEQVADGIICYAEGVEASEIAVLLIADEKDCQAVEEALNEYIRNRAGVFEGYAPQQAAMAQEGIVIKNDRYVTLLICPEVQDAKKAFLGCFGKISESGGNHTESEDNTESKNNTESKDNTESEDNSESEDNAESKDNTESQNDKTENFYNAEAVLQAWRSGNNSSLSERNRRILEAAEDVVASEINDNMSDYEKELAIHDYITGWSSFDYGIFGRSSDDDLADASATPYGVLIDKSAMCHGYSSTFQLFMDMLDIECMTVFGTPSGSGTAHSWNMVKLDGDWYCVDCAWDDPIGGSPCHTYFNVTSDYLRRGSIHRWDESTVPEAVGTVYAYGFKEMQGEMLYDS